jgi:ribosomal protein S18 acetylase RimI-like enzyme
VVENSDVALRFRDAVAEDAPTVVGLVESGYRGEHSRAGWTTEADLLDGTRTNAAEVLEIIAEPESRLILAEREDEVAGCCHLHIEAGGVGYFGMFAVRPLLQGAGIGRALVAEAERVARVEFSCTLMRMDVLSARSELIDWYRRLGYTATGARRPFPYGDSRFGIPRGPGLDFLELAKELA